MGGGNARRLTPAIVLAALAALASTPAAAITIEAGFDHGSLESWNVSGGGGRGGSTVNLVGRDNFYPESSAEFCLDSQARRLHNAAEESREQADTHRRSA